MADRSPGTKAVHAGAPPAEQGTPFLAGPVFASAYHLAGDPATTSYGYGRYANPTWAAYERALAELDGADEAVIFASGMAACTAILLSTLAAGDVLVASADGYPVVRNFATGYLRDRGIDTRFVATDGHWNDALEGARLVWIESPSNPELRMTDIAVLARSAHDAGALVVVDNTLLTPLGQRPLDLGADLAVYADTKAMTGHSDLLMGHVATRDAALAQAVRDWRSQTGAVPGPFETWLAHRSLATLDVRLERQCANAQAIAELLANRDDVADVRYPGVHQDATMLRRRGMVVSFTLESAKRAERFLAACELVHQATSFGGIHSTAERRARWGQGDDVPEGFIRLSAGCEDAADLVADVQAALNASARD